MNNDNYHVMTIREFTRNIYEYIKREGTYVVTIRGSKKLVVTINNYSPEAQKINNDLKKGILPKRVIDDNVVTSMIMNKTLKRASELSTEKYGCGCKVKEGSRLCPKHHRS